MKKFGYLILAAFLVSLVFGCGTGYYLKNSVRIVEMHSYAKMGWYRDVIERWSTTSPEDFYVEVKIRFTELVEAGYEVGDFYWIYSPGLTIQACIIYFREKPDGKK